MLTRNALLFENQDPKQCCVVGFHTAFETGVHGNLQDVQTFSTASWVDGFLYHPQTEALLQWFEFQGAYSYPDKTKLTGPNPCPPGF